MSTLRKSRRAPGSILRLGPLLWAGLLGAFAAAASIGYVWHRDRNDRLLRENAQLRRQIEAQLKLNQELEAQLQWMTRPDVLAARARAMGMVQPGPGQILKVPLVPPGAAPDAGAFAQLVRRPSPVAAGGGR